jgi:hypothetical protein
MPMSGSACRPRRTQHDFLKTVDLGSGSAAAFEAMMLPPLWL